MIPGRILRRLPGVTCRLAAAAVLVLTLLPAAAQQGKQDDVRALEHKLKRVAMAIEQLRDAGLQDEVARLERIHHELRQRLGRIQGDAAKRGGEGRRGAVAEHEKRLHDLELKAHAIEEKLAAAEHEGDRNAIRGLQEVMTQLRAVMSETRAGLLRARQEQAWRSVREKIGAGADEPHQHEHTRADRLEAALHRQQEQIEHQQAMIHKLHEMLERTAQQQALLTEQVRQLRHQLHELHELRGEPLPAKPKRRM